MKAAFAFLVLTAGGAFAANEFPPGTIERKDIAYVAGGHPAQTLDLYLPPGKTNGPRPLLIWIHGGAWKSGVKDWINARYLVAHGYALASIGYRFSQDAKFPAQIQDCNAALNFLRKNAAKYGLDPNRIVIGGGSAGGHLALLLGLARRQKDWGADPDFHPRAVLDFFGVSEISTAVDGLTDPAWLQEVGSIYLQLLGALPGDRPDLARTASPLTYVTADAPPILLLHGAKDTTVPPSQSTRLQAALNRAGVKNELAIVPGAGHDGPMFATPAVEKKIAAFLLEANAPQ